MTLAALELLRPDDLNLDANGWEPISAAKMEINRTGFSSMAILRSNPLWVYLFKLPQKGQFALIVNQRLHLDVREQLLPLAATSYLAGIVDENNEW